MKNKYLLTTVLSALIMSGCNGTTGGSTNSSSPETSVSISTSIVNVEVEKKFSLLDAKKWFKENFPDAVEDNTKPKASDIFKGITGGKYQSMSISKSFEIAVEKADTFGGKEIDYLSSGTADQAYLSLRLAVCELMAQDGNLFPVLLDDALAQYDDNRTKTALEFFNEYSKNGQIIMFTCHNSVLDASKKTGANEIIL